jgi:hypothetical protein
MFAAIGGLPGCYMPVQREKSNGFGLDIDDEDVHRRDHNSGSSRLYLRSSGTILNDHKPFRVYIKVSRD